MLLNKFVLLLRISEYMFITPVKEWKREYKHLTKYTNINLPYEERLEVIQLILDNYNIDTFYHDWLVAISGYKQQGYKHPVKAAFGRIMTDRFKLLLSHNKQFIYDDRLQKTDNVVLYSERVNAMDILELGESAFVNNVIFMLLRGYTKQDIADDYGIDRSLPRKAFKQVLDKWSN